MSAPSVLLRPGLLEGRVVLAVPHAAATEVCAALGAAVATLDAPPLDEEEMAEAVRAAGSACDALVADGAALFGAGGPDGLRHALDATWCAVRAVANEHFIEARRGKVILLAPRAEAGALAEGLRAGLENLARTTSVEWSQYGITTTALLPGPATTDAELAELVAYLVSPAGDYFSGCALTLS